MKYFLRLCPEVETALVHSGIILIKYWIEVSQGSKRADSGDGFMTVVKSGNSVPWTSNPIVGGTTTREPGMKCWPPLILKLHRGIS